jgi:hypothetical protein
MNKINQVNPAYYAMFIVFQKRRYALWLY